jgi:hypothetical protein
VVFADARSVPVSEIITVEETDTHGKHHASGRWQKMENPYAFTGDRAWASSPMLPFSSLKLTGQDISYHLFIFMESSCIICFLGSTFSECLGVNLYFMILKLLLINKFWGFFFL